MTHRRSAPRPRPAHITAILFALLAMLAAFSPAHAGDGPGEFSIPAVSPLTESQLQRLRELARDDADAAALAATVAAAAQPLLGAQPQPLEVIHYEGLVNTDPRRIATVAKLREMGDVARLTRYWQASSDPAAAAALRRFIVAWTSTYKITGNDVNENKFYPLLVAYQALQTTFPDDERQAADAWVAELGERHSQAVQKSQHINNRYTKHVRLLAIASMILDRPEWMAEAHRGVRRFVEQSLYNDGTSEDLRLRDTLTYHCSSLKPVLELAMLAGEEGRALYVWESQRGGSLKKSVDYVVPYAMGEKTREEWTNSKIALDHERAAAGLEEYRPGRLYDPENSLPLMERASYFDADLLRVVYHLRDGTTSRYPSWQLLVNAAARPQ